MSTREDIIREVARTLFVCAWADGVESGEIAGEGPGAGGDWMDYAPRTYVTRFLDPDGSGNVARLGAPCYVTRVEVPDPDALVEARRIVDAFDAEARAHGDRNGVGAYNAKVLSGLPLGAAPVEYAERWHSALTGTDRFAHCLAMHALGSGVGLSDDVPPGENLPGWILHSVPSSDFGWPNLDPERYPPPAAE